MPGSARQKRPAHAGEAGSSCAMMGLLQASSSCGGRPWSVRCVASKTRAARGPAPVVAQAWSGAVRLVVPALFADLSGFTSLAEQLDPEDLTNLINESFSGLLEEVRLRGGWLEKQIGDALVAIFGAPVVHEDDPVRAVHAALAMRERMREHNERLGAKWGRPLELHIGVN